MNTLQPVTPASRMSLEPAPANPRSLPPVLVVEDNDDDYEMIADSLGGLLPTSRVRRTANGDECLDLLEAEDAPEPLLILLDLHTHGTEGLEVLGCLRKNPRYERTPVVILTSSRNPRDIEGCYALACNAYHVKPMDGKEFRQLVHTVGDYWLHKVILPRDRGAER